MQKAQVSIEAVIVIAILLIVLLGSIVIISQKTSLSKPIIDESKNFAECQKIAQAISVIQSAEGITDENITIESDIHIEKNNIIVGQTGCYYFGTVSGDASPGIDRVRGMVIVRKDARGTTYVDQAG